MDEGSKIFGTNWIWICLQYNGKSNNFFSPEYYDDVTTDKRSEYLVATKSGSKTNKKIEKQIKIGEPPFSIYQILNMIFHENTCPTN